MTDEHTQDHPSLVNVEAILAAYGECIPHLRDLEPHFACAARWFSKHGSIYFRPPSSVDDIHAVYVLLPLHLWDPLEPARE